LWQISHFVANHVGPHRGASLHVELSPEGSTICEASEGGVEALHEGHRAGLAAGRAARDRLLALTLRDQAFEILRGVAGAGDAVQKELASALGTAEDAVALSRGLRKLAELGKRYLSQTKGPIAVRAKLLRLDGEYLDHLEAAADTLAKVAKKAGARPAGQKVTQGALDRADGVNLLLLGLIIRASPDVVMVR
jgi:hypothetical protein